MTTVLPDWPVSAQQKLPLAQSFISCPDILAPVLDVRASQPDNTSPGLLFLSTWNSELAQNAPYIYDGAGTLIWSGHTDDYPNQQYFNLQYHQLSNDTTLLSVFRGFAKDGRGSGHIVLLDQAYRTVRTIEIPESPSRTSDAMIPGAALDFHDFQLLNDGKEAIVLHLEPIQADLKTGSLDHGSDWLLDSVFQRIDLENDDKVLFEWRASQHIGFEESATSPSSVHGTGNSHKFGFDYFHLNSVDLFSNGDYLLSARHTDAIYRVSGHDGEVIWRLCGNPASNATVSECTFTLAPDTNFSAQHDARIIYEDDDTVVITIFNNAYNGVHSSRRESSAMQLRLNLLNRTVDAMYEWFPDPRARKSENQGSVQTLPLSSFDVSDRNRNQPNVLISWGRIAEISEFAFTEDEQSWERVLDIAIADKATKAYKVMKAEGWVGLPGLAGNKPDVYFYRHPESPSTQVYMSWNGATSVSTWTIYASEDPNNLISTRNTSEEQESSNSHGKPLTSVPRHGFETHATIPSTVFSSGYVEAIAADGALLGRSLVVEVVVPPIGWSYMCGEFHCPLQPLNRTVETSTSVTSCQKQHWDVQDIRGLYVGFVLLMLAFALGWLAGGRRVGGRSPGLIAQSR